MTGRGRERSSERCWEMGHREEERGRPRKPRGLEIGKARGDLTYPAIFRCAPPFSCPSLLASWRPACAPPSILLFLPPPCFCPPPLTTPLGNVYGIILGECSCVVVSPPLFDSILSPSLCRTIPSEDLFARKERVAEKAPQRLACFDWPAGSHGRRFFDNTDTKSLP